MARAIDANVAIKKIQEYMEDFPNATTRLTTCRAILSMLGDETQTPTLRPITREQVERVGRAEWEWYDEEIGSPLEGVEREWGWRCSKCKVVLPDDFDDPDNPPAMRFCPNCGAPMTDEAVEMVMERLEALHSETKTD